MLSLKTGWMRIGGRLGSGRRAAASISQPGASRASTRGFWSMTASTIPESRCSGGGRTGTTPALHPPWASARSPHRSQAFVAAISAATSASRSGHLGQLDRDVVATRDAADQFENLALQLGVADLGKRLQDGYIDAVQVEIGGSRCGFRFQCGFSIGALEEVGDIDAENLGELKQPARTDPVCSLDGPRDVIRSFSFVLSRKRLLKDSLSVVTIIASARNRKR